MNEDSLDREQLLSVLSEGVSLAAEFFTQVGEGLFDGHQTTREVLSHLVYWHREYCAISRALLLDVDPTLLTGSLAELNKRATSEFQEVGMLELAQHLVELQEKLAFNLLRLNDWNVNFPFKKGCRGTNVTGRICAIDTHIRRHLARQERAYRRGEAWIKAYYQESTE